MRKKPNRTSSYMANFTHHREKIFLFGMPAVSTYSMFESIGSTKWANSSADLFCSSFATTTKKLLSTYIYKIQFSLKIFFLFYLQVRVSSLAIIRQKNADDLGRIPERN